MTLHFARALARLESELEMAACGRGCCQNTCPAPAIAASYQHLLDGLAGVTFGADADEAIELLVADAIDAYDKAAAEIRQDEEDRRQQAEAEYAEAVRRHETAITVECPYCGSAPGLVCRTAGPAAHGSHPKGIHDHRDRYRAALKLLDAGRLRDEREALEQAAARRTANASSYRSEIRYLDRLTAEAPGAEGTAP
jgi:hypothetical protein